MKNKVENTIVIILIICLLAVGILYIVGSSSNTLPEETSAEIVQASNDTDISMPDPVTEPDTSEPLQPLQETGQTVQENTEKTDEPEEPVNAEDIKEPKETEEPAETIILDDPDDIPETTASVKILMYHHIVKDDQPTNSATVTESKFRDDMKYLKENGYRTIHPMDLIGRGGVDEKTVIITFDDGYKSNYELAYPILREYGIKAEINVICSFISDETMTNFLSWDDCREMEASGVIEIGSHTWNNHPEFYTNGKANGIQKIYGESLEAFDARVTEDLKKSCDVIEQELGHRPCTFAYPFGAKDKYSSESAKSLFEITLLTANKTASFKNNLYDLTRYGVTMDTDLSTILP